MSEILHFEKVDRNIHRLILINKKNIFFSKKIMDKFFIQVFTNNRILIEVIGQSIYELLLNSK